MVLYRHVLCDKSQCNGYKIYFTTRVKIFHLAFCFLVKLHLIYLEISLLPGKLTVNYYKDSCTIPTSLDYVMALEALYWSRLSGMVLCSSGHMISTSQVTVHVHMVPQRQSDLLFHAMLGHWSLF